MQVLLQVKQRAYKLSGWSDLKFVRTNDKQTKLKLLPYSINWQAGQFSGNNEHKEYGKYHVSNKMQVSMVTYKKK